MSIPRAKLFALRLVAEMAKKCESGSHLTKTLSEAIETLCSAAEMIDQLECERDGLRQALSQIVDMDAPDGRFQAVARQAITFPWNSNAGEAGE